MPRKKQKTRNPKPSAVCSPSWTLEKGISFSMLSKFLNCRERFRLYSVEGMREEGSAKENMDFGTYFHELIELHAQHPTLSPSGVIRKAVKGTLLKPDTKATADTLFKKYCWWYSESRYEYFSQEDEFRVPYTLPNGRIVHLVGKTDEIPWSPEQPNTLWIQENKTKEKVNVHKIESGVPYDLQTMMYAICVELKYQMPVTGIVYNVIRKPTHRPKKDPKTKKMETQAQFQKRLGEEIENNPKHFFMRWEMLLTKKHMDRFKRNVFDPHLMQLVEWWDSIKHDPFSPWVRQDGTPNVHHWERPFGVYEPMTNGLGPFFDLITRNRRLGVTKGNEPFRELPKITEELKRLGI